MRARSLALLALTLALAAAPLGAQQKPPDKPEVASKAAPAAELKLMFDREVFSFPTGGRRDPYTPLVGKNDAGPRFDELILRGIIYSPGGQSLVLLSDGKKLYRRHRGEMVGNARIVQISPTRVLFSVDNFGVWREESLELRKNPEGAKG